MGPPEPLVAELPPELDEADDPLDEEDDEEDESDEDGVLDFPSVEPEEGLLDSDFIAFFRDSEG